MSRIVLFTGGARSGKSLRAEQYATRLSERVVYLATAEAGDDEMRERIAHH
ncbi:MAG: bifunctional adenosylcobinamide kinase/adenosylcobinamide-phosphate guanylyltransferase, partial [Roseiflexus sp.]|nr:bifunctional adenosylcobinamide kinase/adenosylcobinamide-phosphate guanylyltransferase [Roseiflexus sp.]